MRKRSFRLLLAVSGVVWLTGCGVVLNAPEVTFIVRHDGIVFSAPHDRDAFVAGEIKLVLRNDDEHPHRIVLAQFDADPRRLPASLASAEFPRDDDRILGITKDLEPKEAIFVGGGIGYRVDAARLHVHLRPHRTYLLYDSMNAGAARGLFVQLKPKPA